MHVRNRTLHPHKGQVVSDHIVQFFDTDESRAHHVARFLAEGYAAGEPLIVVAKPISWAAMIEQLQTLGVRAQQAVAEGMLVVKNAEETLRRISRGGSPDPDFFDDYVSKALATLAARGPRVRAYGEMVDILAERDELRDAITLEGFWNVAAERVPLYLFCGYSAAHFVSDTTHRALRDICEAHSGVQRHKNDPLASWLLTAAHNTAADSHTPRH